MFPLFSPLLNKNKIYIFPQQILTVNRVSYFFSPTTHIWSHWNVNHFDARSNPIRARKPNQRKPSARARSVGGGGRVSSNQIHRASKEVRGKHDTYGHTLAPISQDGAVHITYRRSSRLFKTTPGDSPQNWVSLRTRQFDFREGGGKGDVRRRKKITCFHTFIKIHLRNNTKAYAAGSYTYREGWEGGGRTSYVYIRPGRVESSVWCIDLFISSIYPICII